MKTLFLALALVLTGTVAATAAEITITLDDVTVATPDTPWTEAGCELWFSETTAEDLTPGYCLVVADANIGANSGVYIWPARLNLDLTCVEGLETIEVDVYETHFSGSTRAFLYDGTAQVDYAQSYMDLTHTLVLATGGADVDKFTVSAHEAGVWEIRLIGSTIVPTESVSFGAVKALYR